MAKITDVAQLAGVSPSTVSHVLNGKRPISKATTERVLSAIKELGYTPDANARALKSSRTGIIGLIAADITELFVSEIICGVESVIVPGGDHLLLVSGTEFDGDIQKAFTFLHSRKIDGIIISYGISQKSGNEKIPFFPEVPAITINGELNPKIPNISPDNFRGGAEAARQMARAGCKNIAIIGGPEDRPASYLRIKGFLEAAVAAKLSVNDNSVIHQPFTFEGGYQGMKKLLNTGRLYDGFFCANDYIAAGAMTFAQESGLRIPGDIRVIGFDNREFTSFWPIPITTFDQPLRAMGSLAARYLYDCIDRNVPIPPQTLLASSFIPRKSC